METNILSRDSIKPDTEWPDSLGEIHGDTISMIRPGRINRKTY